MMRQGLHALLSTQQDLQVVGEASDGRVAVSMVRDLQPDVVVMDLKMPDLNGIDATRQVVAAKQGVKVICLSAHADERSTSEMFMAGAAGYVEKENAFEELANAIRAVMKEKIYLSPSVAGLMMGDFMKNRSAGAKSAFEKLTSREREVLQMLAEGKSMKSIALQLHVSVKTAESHRRNLIEKLGIDNVAELTKYAIREGLTSL